MSKAKFQLVKSAKFQLGNSCLPILTPCYRPPCVSAFIPRLLRRKTWISACFTAWKDEALKARYVAFIYYYYYYNYYCYYYYYYNYNNYNNNNNYYYYYCYYYYYYYYYVLIYKDVHIYIYFHSRNGCLVHGLNRNASVFNLKNWGQVRYFIVAGWAVHFIAQRNPDEIKYVKIPFSFYCKKCLILTLYWRMEPVFFIITGHVRLDQCYRACHFRSLVILDLL